MKNRLSNIFLIASAIVATAVTDGAADTRWSRVSPEGAGFSAEAPGEPQPSEPGQVPGTARACGSIASN